MLGPFFALNSLITCSFARPHAGEWVDNLKEGRGVYHFPRGGVYEGEWRAGKMEGLGVRTFASGKVQVGQAALLVGPGALPVGLGVCWWGWALGHFAISAWPCVRTPRQQLGWGALLPPSGCLPSMGTACRCAAGTLKACGPGTFLLTPLNCRGRGQLATPRQPSLVAPRARELTVEAVPLPLPPAHRFCQRACYAGQRAVGHTEQKGPSCSGGARQESKRYPGTKAHIKRGPSPVLQLAGGT